MTNDKTPHDPLNAFFADLDHMTPKAAPDLMQRVLAQALLEQDARRDAAASVTPAAHRATGWRAAAARIGGWATIGSLGTAALAGVWIGISAPALIYAASGGYVGSPDGQYVIDVDYDLAFGLDNGGETAQ